MNDQNTSDSLPINIGIDEESRAAVCKILSQVLANQHVLYIKKRNFHWNLVGERFHTLHVFYQEQYAALEKSIDETAERIRQLGGVSPGSMAELLELASLKEFKGELIYGEDSIKALVEDHETSSRGLRDHIATIEDKGDVGTADYLTGLLQGHEQMAWMLRSFLK